MDAGDASPAPASFFVTVQPAAFSKGSICFFAFLSLPSSILKPDDIILNLINVVRLFVAVWFWQVLSLFNLFKKDSPGLEGIMEDIRIFYHGAIQRKGLKG